MARNIEIKARIEDRGPLEATVAAIADDGPTDFHQQDVFFRCDAGRLKLRVHSFRQAELIFYQRPDQAEAKESFYVRTPIGDPASLRETLKLAFGELGEVNKRRTLYLVGRTRIHLDRVDGLGDFLELEVVLHDGENPADGVQEAKELTARLGVADGQLLERSYFEMLQHGGPTA